MPQEPISVRDLIRQEAKTQGVPEALALGVAEQESSFNPTAIGPKLPSGAQAVGTFQLLPDTAKTLGVDPHDPVQNIHGGVRYLRQLLDRHQGDLPAVLKEYGGVRTDTTYVPSVLAKVQAQLTATPATPSPAVGQPPPGTRPKSAVGARPPAGEQHIPYLDATLEAFNPLTRQGFRNDAGMVGALATGPFAPATGAMAWLVPALGAAGAGALAEAGAQTVHGEPISGSSIAQAGSQQGLLELGGSMAMRGIINPIGRRLIGSTVAKYAAEGLTTAQTAVTAEKQALIDRLSTFLSPTPSAAKAGQAVTRVAFGPEGGGKIARDLAGLAVEDAAKTGPPIASAPLRVRLQELSDSITPWGLQGPATTSSEIPRMTVKGGSLTVDQAKAILARNPDLGTALAQIPQELHLPAALQHAREVVEQGGDTISFADAHKLKRMMDAVVTWDRTASKPAEQITKGFRQTLRDSMRGHAPYDEATAHYRAISPLYGKGSVAAGVRKVVETNPEKVVALIKPSNPTGAEQLVHLLTKQAEAGGGGAEGRETLQAVQAAWIHQKLIRPGIEELGKNLDALPADFRQAFLGDPHAAEILENLRLISTAYGAAIRAEQGLAERATALESSSLTDRGRAIDVARFLVHGPRSYWGLEAGMRSMRGPSARDLVTYASASPWATRQLVYALTSSKASQAVADLVRAWGLLQDEPEPEGQPPSRVGQPPSRIGQPPPR